MNQLPYIDFVRDEGAALAAAAQRDMKARVPSCPEWNVSQLVEHTGYVHRDISERLRRKTIEMDPPLEIEDAPSEEAGLLEWYGRGLNALEQLLRELPTDSPAWTWWPPDNTAGFWRRRMALETAVHRWDAENATGMAAAIDPELAADGVDEFLDIHMQEDGGEPYEGAEGTVHFHDTDGRGEWLLRLTKGETPEVRRGHERGTAAIRGKASDLLLFVWRRKQPSDYEVLGDEALVNSLWEYFGPGA
ncbi:MAG: hypothetical protein QOG21_241 [Actinomycetota bacterium]|nr:hypothetical protein [Actinomycetota bacterium]